MATEGGGDDAPVARKLLDEPYRFNFFQAVRLLQQLGEGDGREPVGRDAPPGREAVRFVARRGLAFPASSIHDIRPAEADRDLAPPGTPIMTVAFMGLTGPMGVLPTFYTERLTEEFQRAHRRHRGDIPAMAAFYDLFNHRLVSLFYRAWEKYHPFAAGDGEARGPIERAVFSLIGLGLPANRRQHAGAGEAPLLYAGLFAHRRRHAGGLEDLLRDHFGEPVEVIQFMGRWLALGPGSRTRLRANAGENNQLRVNFVLGSRVWDERGKFRLRVGPLSYESYLQFLPGRPAFRALVEMTRLYVGPELEFDIQLVLKAEEVPRFRLGADPNAATHLRRTSWLMGRAATADAENAVFPSGV